MGEVFAGVAIIIGILCLPALVYFITTLFRKPPVGAKSEYDNHLSMARWIDRQMEDDMVRCTIEQREQNTAKALLDRFYGEQRHLTRGEQ